MIRLYEDAVVAKRHINRVTQYLLLEEPGCLGTAFRIWAAGGDMSDELRSEITAYQLCVLDDSMGEGPHALLSREATRSPRSSPAWWSGTFRLTQNLRLAEQASVAGDSNLAFF